MFKQNGTRHKRGFNMQHDGDKLTENAMLTCKFERTLGKRSRNHLTDGSINYNQNKHQIIRQTKMMLQ